MFEAVVTTSLPGENRIFWPYQDVQFYIRDDNDGIIHSTGNNEIIQQVINVDEKLIRSNIPNLDFWKNNNILFELDDFYYVDEQKQLNFDYDLSMLLEKFKFHQTQEFENKRFWYLLKFLFIASELIDLRGYGHLLGGVPLGLKIKCRCGSLLEPSGVLKGIFKIPEREEKHSYYLYISDKCEDCGAIHCIYRDKGPHLLPMLLFMNFLDPSWNYSMNDIEMVGGWREIIQQAIKNNMKKMSKMFAHDFVKFIHIMEKFK